MNSEQKNKLACFKAAKQLALTLPAGCARRARCAGSVTNYTALHDASGRRWVIGDTAADITNPDAVISGQPAREIFGDFSIIYK